MSVWIASQPDSKRREALDALTESQLAALATDWPLWAHPAQLPPEGDWRTWLFLGGRGAGKTRAGAEWLRLQATPGRRLALVGPTLHDVREVMVQGPSGLANIGSAETRPTYETSRRRLVWPNGAVAYAFSAEDPEGLRGPQFHAAWADEFAAWRRSEEVLAMLRLGLRLGDDPRLVITTTPKGTPALRRLMEEPGCRTTRASTQANAQALAPGFIKGLQALYGGTRLEAQELDGLVLAPDGALWTPEMVASCRGEAPADLQPVIVAVDPPATAGGDACGIVVVGKTGGMAWVLADRSVRGEAPLGWASAVGRAVADFGAREVVAEVNQGGDMVETVLRLAGVSVPVRPVRARLGKKSRAEPVAALYEQGRVRHAAPMPELEEELMAFGAAAPKSSPDRADALVWAVSELLLKADGLPRVRRV